MTTSFQIATENATLSKDRQLQTWFDFQALLKLLSKKGLKYNNNSLQILISRATPNQTETIRKALKARDTLVYTNQALVIKLAQQYSNNVISIGDLIQTGNLGLMKALIKFKPKKNAKFSSYAYFWIKALIFEVLYRVDPIYIPQKVKREMQTFSFVSIQEEDRVMQMSNGDRITTSTINEVMSDLKEDERTILECAYGFDGNTTILTVAMLNNWTYQTALNKVEELLDKIRNNSLVHYKT